MLNFIRGFDSKLGIVFTCFLATANYFFLLLLGLTIIEPEPENAGSVLVTCLVYGGPISIAAAVKTGVLMKEFKKKRKSHINGIIHLLHFTIFTLIISFFYLSF